MAGGKTTLIKLILGLLKPGRGLISVFGRTPRLAAPLVGYVPQDLGANRTIPVTVEQVVLMGRMRGGFARFTVEDQQVAQAVLERVGMWDYRLRRIGDLSGGQRQRVFVARALVSAPQLLLLDEPTASVDTEGQTQFYDFLKELNQTVTILVVSHDLMVLSSYIKSVACVSRELHFHNAPEITSDMIQMAYHCPVELIAHGLPHRVLPTHKDE